MYFWAAFNLSQDLGYDFSPYKNKDFVRDMEKASKLDELGVLPKFKSPNDANRSGLDYSLIGVFGAQAYRYHDLVKVEEGEIFLDCGA